MRLVVGLGNAGPGYEWTPHNMGFLAVDALAERAKIPITRREARALVGRGEVGGQEVVLAKPQTMMNASGLAVRMLLERYHLEPAATIVLIDEVDLPWGLLRIRERGRNSTHNGLRSVIAALATDEFVRVRMGVRPERIWGDRVEYVLSTMRADERRMAQQEAGEAAGAVELILREGVAKAMVRFNRKASPKQEAKE
jgi:peptidyl-tRNA hydrolase, PTH1 family